MKLTEQMILSLAPNASASANGKKLSRSGSFSAFGRNEEGTVYWADCAGSGKTPYHTSVDLTDPEGKVISRCSCPSRQFPCKHGLGLMYEILAGKDFPVSAMPEELVQKLEKQAQRKRKAEEPAQPKKTRKTTSTAWKKKLQKQLEGLDLTQKMVDDLLKNGISTLSGTSAQSFEKAAKELGNYYLTGPQMTFTRIAHIVRKIQNDRGNAEVQHAEALRLLISLHATVKKSRAYLTEKLESGDSSLTDSVLYEALGGVWRLEDLRAIGAYRENVPLVQLSLDVSYDDAKKEYMERGFWMDISNGTISQTLNYRPAKALKYVRADDSNFELQEIPVLFEYPGEFTRRIRWEGSRSRSITSEEQARLPGFAVSGIAEAVKLAKNQFKNTMQPKFMPILLSIGSIGLIGDNFVLTDPAGARIVLRDRLADGDDHRTTGSLAAVSDRIDVGSAVFGLLFYDPSDHRICLHPYSIITPTQIIRLLF